jgi:hypothetical protein
MQSDLIERACLEIGSRFQELFDSEAADEQPPSRLYHYTSAEGLLGIIHSGEVWATNVLYLNDASELSHARDILESELKSQPMKLPDETAQHAQQTIPLHSRNLPIDNFVVSFCEDGDLLSQWRAYGERGGGYSIGFHRSALLAAAKRLQGGCALRKIRYHQDQKEEMIRRRIEVLRETLEPLGDQLKPGPDAPWEGSLIWAQAAGSFHPALALMKNAAFQEEREWRIVRTLWKQPVPNWPWPVRLRIIRNQLAPYVPLSWVLPNTPTSREVRGIEEVYCGPSTNPDLKIKAVEDLLRAHNCWNVKVLQSKVPLRA